MPCDWSASVKETEKNDQNKYGCDADGCWCLTAADAGCQSFLNWIIDWLINFFCYIRLLLLLLSFGIGLCSIYTVLSSFKRESSQALATGWITLAIELFIILCVCVLFILCVLCCYEWVAHCFFIIFAFYWTEKKLIFDRLAFCIFHHAWEIYIIFI